MLDPREKRAIKATLRRFAGRSDQVLFAVRRHTLAAMIAGTLLVLALSACGGETATPSTAAPAGRETLDPQQAFDLAWAALEPNTSSHDPANWALAEVRQVTDREVAPEFDEEQPGYGCPGPRPPANRPVKARGAYWYVVLQRRPATPPPDVPTISPTAPPLVPEPFIYQALFLVDAEGEIVARKLFCVIY